MECYEINLSPGYYQASLKRDFTHYFLFAHKKVLNGNPGLDCFYHYDCLNIHFVTISKRYGGDI